MKSVHHRAVDAIREQDARMERPPLYGARMWRQAGQLMANLPLGIAGFVLSVILTAIPFWMVMGDVLKNSVHTSIIIMALAAVQIVVHMIYFLHMNTKSEAGWTMMALIFTVIIVVIVISGSLWVMYHMNLNMMPQMQAEMSSAGM